MDSHAQLAVKSLVTPVKQFFEVCLGGVLSEEHWDDDIVELHQYLRLKKWSKIRNQHSKHSDFFEHIVDKSKSTIFKQLWKDTLKQQTSKKSSENGAIQVAKMGCVDVSLFLKGLNVLNTESPFATIARLDEEFIFKNKINGEQLLANKKSFGLENKNVNEETLFSWDGKLSMKILCLMYNYIVLPRFEELKTAIERGIVLMKHVEYYFDNNDNNNKNNNNHLIIN